MYVSTRYNREIRAIKYQRSNMFQRQFLSSGAYPLLLTVVPKSFQLASVNKNLIDANCDNLSVNEVICLGFVGQDCTNVAVVNSGDTCTSIATTARTSLATLRANNPNVDANCDNIHIGEVCYGLN